MRRRGAAVSLATSPPRDGLGRGSADRVEQHVGELEAATSRHERLVEFIEGGVAGDQRDGGQSPDEVRFPPPGANAAQDGLRLLALCVLSQQSAEGVDGNIGHSAHSLADHVHALACREERLLFQIGQDGHNKRFEEQAASLDQIEMPFRNRIKGAGIDGERM